MVDITVNKKGDALIVKFPPNNEDIAKARNIPSRTWIKTKRAWKCAASLANVQYLDEVWPHANWSEGARGAKSNALERAAVRAATIKAKEDGDLSQLDLVPFKHPPFDHQKKALLLGRDCEAFAYLMDQGTGKTKTLLDDAAHNWREDRIDFLVIISPNSVKTNWVNAEGTDEVSEHMAPDVDYVKGVWFSSPNKAQKKHFEYFLSHINDPRKLKILSLNIESLSVKRVQDFLINLCSIFRVMMVIDESTRIKTPGAQRTKVALKIGKMCKVRRILTGTPVIKSLENAYTQFGFLDPDILGFQSFYAFRNHYCRMGGYENKQIIGYQNTDELSNRIASASFRILKDQCLDLPPKVYSPPRHLEMTKEQNRAYNDMKELMAVQLEEQEVTASIVLTQMLRLQQIVGGYLPEMNEEGETTGVIELIPPSRNPKIQECLNIIEEAGDQKVIIWARFRAEIEGIINELSRKEISCVAFHGGVAEADRVRAREEFQRATGPRVFVGNPSAGGIGINLYRASVAIYFSNSYSTEDRVQSEDRCHRIGSGIHDSVTYHDLICTGTIDTKIISTLRANKQISDEVMKDGWREWI